MQLARLAPGPGGAAPPTRFMHAELESMKGFKKDVDRLIDEHLTASPADPKQMADERIPATALGTGFAEATGLHSAYTQVHDELTGLSRLLSGQIKALTTAIDASLHGYESIDLATREQMLAIQAESQQHYQPKLDPYAEEHGRAQAPGQTQPTGANNQKSADEDDGGAKL